MLFIVYPLTYTPALSKACILAVTGLSVLPEYYAIKLTSALYVPALATCNTPSFERSTHIGAPVGATGLNIDTNGTVKGKDIPEVIFCGVYIKA